MRSWTALLMLALAAAFLLVRRLEREHRPLPADSHATGAVAVSVPVEREPPL